MSRFRVVDRRRPRFGLFYQQDTDSDPFRSLTPHTRCVYFALLPFSNDDKNGDECCWPRASRLMDVTGFGERTVRRAVAELEKAGFLEISKLHLGSGRRVNLYILSSPAACETGAA